MKVDYKNPRKREGVFIWEGEVMFFPTKDYPDFVGKDVREVEEKLKSKYGKDSLCFPSSRRGNSFFVWIAKVKEWESQKEVKTSYNQTEKKVYKDGSSGNTISVFDFSDSILGKKQIKKSFSFEAFQAELSADSWDAKDYDKSSSLYREYTRSEARLGQTDSIVEHAKEITKERENYLAKAKFIYNWVLENINYKKSGRRKGVIRVFEEGSGNTEEVSLLFVVLLRAVGIPARLVSGAWGENGKKQEMHSWAEFYIQDVGWIPVDCAKKMFGKMDNERIIFSKGENILLEKAPENSEIFGINYKKVLYMQPDAVYIDSLEEGFFVVRKSKYLLIKDLVRW